MNLILKLIILLIYAFVIAMCQQNIPKISKGVLKVSPDYQVDHHLSEHHRKHHHKSPKHHQYDNLELRNLDNLSRHQKLPRIDNDANRDVLTSVEESSVLKVEDDQIFTNVEHSKVTHNHRTGPENLKVKETHQNTRTESSSEELEEDFEDYEDEDENFDDNLEEDFENSGSAKTDDFSEELDGDLNFGTDLVDGDGNRDSLPVFIEEPKNSYVIRNKPATLWCKAANALQVSFIKQRKHIVDV